MNIIGTGLSGMVGSRIVELLSDTHTFTNLSLETGVDITKRDELDLLISGSDAPWVFHFAAKTDVDACEKDRTLGHQGGAWTVNAKATEDIADICRKTGKRMLYISTDYVFDGNRGEYSENDIPKPAGWYGITKFEGEKRVAALGDTGLTVRIANPYRAGGDGKMDFVHKILSRLRADLPVTAPSDGQFTPTFVDDIALAIKTLVNANASGIYHAVGGDSLSQYDAAVCIAKIFGFAESKIGKTTFGEFFSNRAPRPVHASMINGKINILGIKMANFEDGLRTVKRQEVHSL
jgi:dTDP-4-dehydrorhamnose reductase